MSANPGALPGWFHPRPNDDGEVESGPHSGVQNDQTTKASHSATTGGKDDQSPVVVWEAANRMEAEIVAGRLKSENIPTIISGDVLGSIYGLTTGSLAAANVLVPAALAEKALAILESSVEWDESEAAEASDNDNANGDSNRDASSSRDG